MAKKSDWEAFLLGLAAGVGAAVLINDWLNPKCPSCGDRMKGRPASCPSCGVGLEWQK